MDGCRWNTCISFLKTKRITTPFIYRDSAVIAQTACSSRVRMMDMAHRTCTITMDKNFPPWMQTMINQMRETAEYRRCGWWYDGCFQILRSEERRVGKECRS